MEDLLLLYRPITNKQRMKLVINGWVRSQRSNHATLILTRVIYYLYY
jgi:hypothetical protein